MPPETSRQPAAEVDYNRQAALMDPGAARAAHVTICGLGTVGSHAAVELARLGVGSLHLVDFDVVEAHNLPSQAYTLADLGRGKAQACAEHVESVSDHIRLRVDDQPLTGIEAFDPGPVVLAVDSMQARRMILHGSVALRPGHRLVLDGRMAGARSQLLAFDPTDARSLERWTTMFDFDDSQAEPVPCGGRSVSFIGALAGARIAAAVRAHLVGRPVPFFSEVDMDSFTQFGF